MTHHLLRKLYTSSIIYALANSIEALAPFILAVMLTRKLSPEEYGIWVLFIALFTFLRPIISLSVQDALKMHYFELKRDTLSEFILSSFLLTSVLTLLLSVIVFFTKSQLSVWLKFPESWMISIVVTAYLYSLFYFLLTFNQFENNKKRFILLHLLQSSVAIGLAVTLVFYDWDWQGAILGKISGLFITFFLGAWWLSRDLTFRINAQVLKKAKELIKFGLYYLPTGLSLVIIPLTDRMMITNILGLHENGLYGVAALFGSAFFIVINGFLFAWMPWLFQRLIRHNEQDKSEIGLVSTSFFLVLPVAALGFYFISIFVAPLAIGKSFYAAFPLISWVLSAFVMQGYFLHNQAFLLFKKNAILMSVCSFFCIILNIILSYLWALSYGVKGVIIATSVSYLVSSLLIGLFVLYVYRKSTSSDLDSVKIAGQQA